MTEDYLLNIVTEREVECPVENVTQDGYCPTVFDGWSCINRTPSGAIANLSCPFFIVGFDPKRYAYRTCLDDGTWFKHPKTNRSWTNYTTCVDMEDLELRNLVIFIHKLGYSISLPALLLSLIIFFYFRSLSCARIQIHKNLFLSLAVSNSLWLLWYDVVVDDLAVLEANGVPCQILYVVNHYFLVATYFWMFCEGLYLHTLLVIAFVNEHRMMIYLYVIGWGTPAIFITIYASLRASYPEETLQCWMSESVFQWVLSGPVCLSIFANLVFLINIVRLLLTKLRGHPSSPKRSSRKDSKPGSRRGNRNASGTRRDINAQSEITRKAIKATIILIPLFGLQYILIPFRPEAGSKYEKIYQILSAVVVSFQGLCVAFLFCFLNGEVLSCLKKKWQQYSVSRKRPWQSCSAVTTVSDLICSTLRLERSSRSTNSVTFQSASISTCEGSQFSRSSFVHEVGGGNTTYAAQKEPMVSLQVTDNNAMEENHLETSKIMTSDAL